MQSQLNILRYQQYTSNEIPNLDGSVTDAKAIQSFLTDHLHVPDSHIVLLANEQATRSAIISHFESHLTHNTAIQNNDPIVIYYSGHGSRAPAPQGWMSTDGRIETLCPHDEREDSQGEWIHGIPDRTINALLRELAAVKGNNIVRAVTSHSRSNASYHLVQTVILDSCHSGGAARKAYCDVSATARSVITTRPIPSTLDSAIWMSDYSRSAREEIPPGFQHKFMESHVLLAACQQDQFAYEVLEGGCRRGFFTSSLVKQLRQVALDRVTYSELFDLLPESNDQKPHCEGTNKNKILFRGMVKGGYAKTFQLVTNPDKSVEVKAGRIHGVDRATEFTVLDRNGASPSTEELGILVADQVYETFSLLMPRPGDSAFIVPTGARAVVSDWKNDALTMKVFVNPDLGDQLAAYIFPTQDTIQPHRSHKRNFIQVNSRSEASVVIWLDSGGDLVVESLDPLISKYAIPTTSFALQHQLKHVPDILEAIAHFNFHLGLYQDSNPLGEEVKMELYRLIGPRDNRTPDTKIGNLLLHDHATIVVDESAKYGVAMVNHSLYDLFPYLFYFDPSLYSIDVSSLRAVNLRDNLLNDTTSPAVV
jgi:hypothetical protein